MHDPDAIPTVNCEALLNEIRAGLEAVGNPGGRAPGTVIVNWWHYVCLLEWAKDIKAVPEDTDTIVLGAVLLVPDCSPTEDAFDIPACAAFVIQRAKA